MLVFLIFERILLEIYRGDKVLRILLFYYYSDFVLLTFEKNLQKFQQFILVGIGKIIFKLIFCYVSMLKVEFFFKYMLNICSFFLNDIIYVVVSIIVLKNLIEFLQVVLFIIIKEKLIILILLVERKFFICLFILLKDRDEGQFDSSCLENSFLCISFLISFNFDFFRRFIYVVENLRIIDGSFLEGKRFFFLLDDEEQENKENILLIQSFCVSVWDKMEFGERIKNIDVGLEDKVILIGYTFFEEYFEKDRFLKVKVEINVEEKVSLCRKVDFFVCFVLIEDLILDYNRKEEIKYLVEVFKIKFVRLKSSNLFEKFIKGFVFYKRKVDEVGI